MHIRSGFSRAHIVGLTVLLTAVFLACSSVPPAPRPPVLQVDATTRELGELAEGSNAVAEFEVRNEGSGVLELKLAGRPAGLRGSPPESLTIAPGERARVSLAPDTWAVFGPAEVKARYTTNDPVKPQVELSAKFVIRAFVVANPGFARFNFVQGEAAGTVTQTLWTIDGKDFEVTGVESPWPWLEVAFRETTEAERLPRAGRQWRVETTITPGAEVGPISGNVRVHVTHPDQKEVHVAIGGFVRPVLAATPPSADFGLVMIGQPLEKSTIDIQNFASESIELLGATADVAGFDFSIEPVVPGHRFRLRVSINDAAKEGDFVGTIVIPTSTPKHPLLKIPFSVTFRREAGS